MFPFTKPFFGIFNSPEIFLKFSKGLLEENLWIICGELRGGGGGEGGEKSSLCKSASHSFTIKGLLIRNRV